MMNIISIPATRRGDFARRMVRFGQTIPRLLHLFE